MRGFATDIARLPRSSSPTPEAPICVERPISDNGPCGASRESRTDRRRTPSGFAILRESVAAQGTPLSAVACLLRHQHPRTTMRRARVGDRTIQAASERIGASIVILLDGRRLAGADSKRPKPSQDVRSWLCPTGSESVAVPPHRFPTFVPRCAISIDLGSTGDRVLCQALFGPGFATKTPRLSWLRVQRLSMTVSEAASRLTRPVPV